ncbi:putative kinesin [Trichoderma barbatum]
MDDRKHSTTATDQPTGKRMRSDASSGFPTADAGVGPCSLTVGVFTVGWICALGIELAASVAMLDEKFPNLPQILGDTNNYTLGRMGEHHVVLACLPAGTTGTNAAATASTNMKRSFPNIQFGLMVGVGGGAPDQPSDDPRNDIRLGDVVVSHPTHDSGGVLQYDFGKTMAEGKFVQTGSLNKTSISLRTGISALQARHRMQTSLVPLYMDAMLQSHDKMRGHFDHPGWRYDQLFRADYDHIEGKSSCETCDKKALLVRKPRTDNDSVIHYGLIGSANQVMRHGKTREKLRQEKGILCFEMEAAGLMDSFDCLVIRGICDYADSHKNKRWQPYAAAAAAAYAKEILSIIPAAHMALTSITKAATIHDTLRCLIETSGLKQLLQLLPMVERSQNTPAIPTLDPNDPKFSWLLRNIDYKTWKSNDGPVTLCLASSLAYQLSQVSSYIVGQNKNTNCPVIYFFCSHRENIEFDTGQSAKQNMPLANILICTLFGQIVYLSPREKGVLVMRTFIKGLLQKAFVKKSIQNWTKYDFQKYDLSTSLQNLLGNMTTSDLLTVFQKTLDYAKPQVSLLVLDGIEKAYQGGRLLHLIEILINDLRRQNPNIKVLLAGPTLCDIKSLSQESLCIEQDKERRECLSSLRFENTRYGKISPEHSGSFEWIWTHNEYTNWSSTEASRLLYIQGKPGSGKSTLTKYFDSNLQTREPAAKQAIIAKFFYSFREGEPQRSHYNMLISLIYDILHQDEAFFYHQCQTEYRAHLRSCVKWDYESLKRMLRSLHDYYSTQKRYYFIIDAVDESEEVDRREILNLLCGLCSEIKFCVVKIFIASRPVTQLEARRDQFNFIRLQDETISDISNFAHSLLDGLDLASAITYMIENAQGVFLWVKLTCAELLIFHEDGYSEKDIFDMLKQLPTELEELYALMLDKMRAKKSCLSYGLKMFRFILFAKRPLTVDELLHSLGIPDNLESDWIFQLSDGPFQKRVPSSDRIIISCGGNFIEIKQQPGGDRIVQVIHQTAHEFLLNPHGAVANSEFRVEKDHAHVCIAIVCIRYLMICAAKTSLRMKLPSFKHWHSGHYESFVKYLEKRPLASYVFCYLKDHIDSCLKYVNQNPSIQHLASELTGDWASDPFNFLLESWAGSHLESADLERIRSGLLFAATMGGFDVAAETLISAGVNVNITEESGCTPLSWAARNGHESTTRLLISKGAAVEHRDDVELTPLLWAAINGHLATVEVLLGQGANTEATDVCGKTPLVRATLEGHQAIVELLLQHGANIEANWECGPPLATAAANGHLAIVELLLRRGAQVNAAAMLRAQTPLLLAVVNQQQAVAELLLENGAIMYNGSWGADQAPLILAAEKKYLEYPDSFAKEYPR